MAPSENPLPGSDSCTAHVNVNPASVWLTLNSFCFFILRQHLCSAVRQFRVRRCCHLCRGTTGSVTKGSHDAARGTPNVEAGRPGPSIQSGGQRLGFITREASQGYNRKHRPLSFLCIYMQCVSACLSSGIASSIYSVAGTLAQCPCRNVM